LRAVGRKSVGVIIDFFPELLNFDDLFADRSVNSRPALEITGRGEMVGMRMRVENPFERVALLLNMIESYESFVIQERWPDSEGPPMWTNENRAV